MKNRFSRRPHLLSAVLCLAAVAPAFGGEAPPGWVPAPPGVAGFVLEVSSGPAWFNVYQTGLAHQLLHPAVAIAVPGVLNVAGPYKGKYTALIPVAGIPQGYDIQNRTFFSAAQARHAAYAGNGGGVAPVPNYEADLSIEALYTDSEGNVQIEGTFGRLEETLGLGVGLEIPDLYTAEVTPDADGMSTLYSLVDINEYMAALGTPTYTLGDDFTINDGTCAALPGMLFSTTPFVFNGGDPSSNLGAFSDTPFTGDALDLTLHDVWATPDRSSTLALLGLGTLSLLAYDWRRRTA